MGQAVDQAGNLWETDDATGKAIRLIRPASAAQSRVIGSPNPTYDYQAPKADADLRKTNVDIGSTITDERIKVAKAPGEIAKTGAEGQIAQGKVETGVGVIGEAQRAKAIQQFNGGRELRGKLADLQAAYDAGPGSTNGFPTGVLDYLPNALYNPNSSFDKAAERTRGPIRNSLGVTGGEMNSMAEAKANIGQYIPTSGEFDSDIEDKMDAIRGVQNKAIIEAIQQLGGIPDATGRVVTPLTQQQLQVIDAYASTGFKSPFEDKRDVLAALTGQGPSGPTGGGGAGGGGGVTTLGLSQGDTFTTDKDLAVAAAVTKAFRAGGGVQEMAAAAKAAGGNVTMDDLSNFEAAIKARKAGQSVTFNPQSTGKRSALDQAMGAAIMSPAGTALATAVSGTGLNALDAFLPNQMGALRNLNPNAGMVGDIAGAIGGTQAMGKLAGKALSATAPRLAARVTGGGAGAQFARNALADTAYGTAYGNNVQGDALTGGLSGLFGSVGGQLGGKAIAATLAGAPRTRAGQFLADKVGDLTIGQQLGGFVKSAEDALTSVPGIGDLINARRGESLKALQRAAFKEVGNINAIGQQGLDDLGAATGNAYRGAVAGKNIPLDGQFAQDIANLRAMRDKLAPDWQVKFDTAIQNRVDPFAGNPSISGDEYQQIMRGLKDYKGARSADGFEADYQGAIGNAQEAFKGAALRSGDADMVARLAEADQMYRGQKILEDAISRNRKDASGIGADMFRPGDLTEAVYQNGKKYKGNVPLKDLAKAAQEVIPSKMPDSGTAKRLMYGSLATAGLGGAVGGGYGGLTAQDDPMSAAQSGGQAGATTGALALMALAAGGTKGGQKALSKLLFERPQAMSQISVPIADLLRAGQRKGLLGAAAVPLLFEGGY